MALLPDAGGVGVWFIRLRKKIFYLHKPDKQGSE